MEKWNSAWENIEAILEEKLYPQISICKHDLKGSVVANIDLTAIEYAKEAKNQYLKKQTDKSINVKLPSWTLTSEIRSKPEAERFIKEACSETRSKVLC